jgi:hypothetical protein
MLRSFEQFESNMSVNQRNRWLHAYLTVRFGAGHLPDDDVARAQKAFSLIGTREAHNHDRNKKPTFSSDWKMPSNPAQQERIAEILADIEANFDKHNTTPSYFDRAAADVATGIIASGCLGIPRTISSLWEDAIKDSAKYLFLITHGKKLFKQEEIDTFRTAYRMTARNLIDSFVTELDARISTITEENKKPRFMSDKWRRNFAAERGLLEAKKIIDERLDSLDANDPAKVEYLLDSKAKAEASLDTALKILDTQKYGSNQTEASPSSRVQKVIQHGLQLFEDPMAQFERNTAHRTKHRNTIRKSIQAVRGVGDNGAAQR